MEQSDCIVIGAGIAGLSLAARLSRHMQVRVIEGESALGYHASGRSVAFAHYGLGEMVVRTLTMLSMPELANGGVAGAPHAVVKPALHIASQQQMTTLDELEAVHRHFGCDVERMDGEAARAFVPVLKAGAHHCHSALIDHGALKLDTDAMLQSAKREVLANGGELVCDASVCAIHRSGNDWNVGTRHGAYAAPLLVNAAGAWADEIARMAGAAPVGIEPRRRTVIAVNTPEGSDSAHWPFVKTVSEGFYMLSEGASQVLVSSMDQTPCAPCDAAAEELDMAIAADRVQSATTLEIRRIEHSWAGLRSFAPDELPVVGFAPEASGFFWCAGQGGAGFQTAPALARLGEALVLAHHMPTGFDESGLNAQTFSPARFSA